MYIQKIVDLILRENVVHVYSPEYFRPSFLPSGRLFSPPSKKTTKSRQPPTTTTMMMKVATLKVFARHCHAVGYNER
jgi:hypothetical protein